MNEKIIINARIVDPSQKLDEMGSIIIDKNGKVKAIGKKVTKKDCPNAEVIDVKKNLIIPGIVDMKAFVGEPGFEYKENFRTLSQAALAGGVTSIVTMPNTKPIIDNSDPFAALAFRFFCVAVGFYLFSFYSKCSILALIFKSDSRRLSSAVAAP